MFLPGILMALIKKNLKVYYLFYKPWKVIFINRRSELSFFSYFKGKNPLK